MPKVFTNTTLPASDLNTYMIQPGTGSRTRMVSGITAVVFSNTSAVTGTISYGFTFGAAPVVTYGIQVGSNLDLDINWQTAPGTTSVAYRIFQVGGSNVSGTANVHWIAVGSP